MRHFCSFILLLIALVACAQEDSVVTVDRNRWKHDLLHARLNLSDTTLYFPPALDVGVKLYRWGDHTFNYYDSTYVVGTGKKWKVMLKNTNWIDTYAGRLTQARTAIRMNSNVTSNFGLHLAYMALSLEYMVDINRLLGGKNLKNRHLEFSFTSSRIAIETYYIKNSSNTNMHRLGDYHEWSFRKGAAYKFTGLKRESYGVYGYYIFNHEHYAQAAAYCFSKIQRRSAGSFIGGIHLSRQDVNMDFSVMSELMQSYLPDERRNYRFKYRDFCLLLGYGYNWVPHRRWLFNITAIPSLGYRHSFPTSIEGEKGLLSTNIRGKTAIILNRGNYFYGLHLIGDAHWYHSRKYSFVNTNVDLNVTSGFRF